MSRFIHFSMVGLIVVLTTDARFLWAEGVVQETQVVREIFVPFEDLSVLLEHEPRRVLLSRQEYEDLLSLARVTPEHRAPRPAAVISAEYAIHIAQGRANITGTLVVDVLEDGLQAVGLSLGGVGLRRATLDGQGAPIGLADDGRFLLFVEGRGQHRLKLDMVAPLETAAARQVLNFMIPTPAATKLHLTVPGDVEIRSGAATITRVVDADADVTRFELLPKRGHNSLVMTLNSRSKRQQRVVVARSVIVAEITEAYERLHATFSMAILRQAVDHFRFALPDGFQITNVKSPLLARWGVVMGNERRILDIRLREKTTETVVLKVSAVRSAQLSDAWSLPKFEALDVAGQVAVIGLLVEDRLEANSITTDGLIPIDTAVLHRALPATIFEGNTSAPSLRPIVAFYAPQSQFSLRALFTKPPSQLFVTTNLLLTLTDRRQELRGGFALLPQAEELFEFDFSLPAWWHVTSVTTADGTVLPIERYGESDGPSRIHVKLPQGITAGEERNIYFHAHGEPVEWLSDWTSRSVTFPVVAVVGAAREEGAIAVATRDDLSVRPEALERLRPLDENEKDDYGLGGVTTNLAYRFESQPYQATLTAVRVKPRLTAQTYSFFKIKSDVLIAHYEISYDIEEARVRRLAFVLPAGTPAALSIRGLDGVTLKEYGSEIVDGMRRWNILLAQGRSDTVRLAIDLQQPLGEDQSKDLVLPVVRADGVAYQSGFVAVEGSAELDVQINAKMREVDIGELVDAEYKTGKRLLGVYRFVGDSPEASLSFVRHPAYGLPTVLVQESELVTVLSSAGLTQTAVRYRLRTKAQLLEVQLPPGSTLWSAELDGTPAKPQREGQKLLLSLPAGGDDSLHDLRIVYETPVDPVAFLADVEMSAPRLFVRAEDNSSSAEVPAADLRWHLYLPTGYRVLHTAGTVVTDQISAPEPAFSVVAKFLYRLGGGVEIFYGGFRLARARELSRYAGAARMRDNLDDFPSSQSVAPAGTYEVEFLAGADAKLAQREESPDAAALPRADQVPPPARPAPVDADASTSAQATQVKTPWALQGVRSLKIDLQQIGEQITFRSLGKQPRLVVTLAERRRVDALAWALALGIGLVGLSLTRRPTGIKVRFVVLTALMSTLLPLITGSPFLTCMLNMTFYAACLLPPYYLLAGMAQWLAGKLQPTPLPNAPAGSTAAGLTTPAALVILIALMNTPAALAAAGDPEDAPLYVMVVKPPEPVEVPDDAIILPYDPDSETGIKGVDHLLVPYDRFIELWNRAYPDERIETVDPPAPYALAGASFTAVLEGDEYLLVEGSIDINVYTDGFVTIPLPVGGGVLARADLDGRPARLGIVQPAQHASEQAEQHDNPNNSLVVLHVSGKGRHHLDLAIRLRVSRRGGWRVVQGRLPAAPASALALRLPDPQTEVRLKAGTSGHVQSHVTAGVDERILTALTPDGTVSIEWRSKVSEGIVDQSLIATSTALLDVQEDGLRLAWELDLQFRRGRRSFFKLSVPHDYLIVKVEGDNVRGWHVQPELSAGLVRGNELEVSLLKTAEDSAGFTIHLWRRGLVGHDDFTEFEAPVITVNDAALHHGELVIRRSPLIDLRVLTATGVTRADLKSTIKREAQDPLGGRPFGIRPFQAYKFAGTPFSLRFEAAPVSTDTSAIVQAILKIAPNQRSLEAKVNLNVRHRRIHRVRIVLPESLDVEHVSAPGRFEWALSEMDGEQLLSIYLATGRKGQLSVVVRGTVGRDSTELAEVRRGDREVSLPRIRVLDVRHQQGHMVIQVDPEIDVEATDLKNCETVLLKRVYGWLSGEQRRFARLVVQWGSAEYSGLLRLSKREPLVNCYTVTNVRVTDRAIEETILLDFSIARAGIRELSFLLPTWMSEARVSVPLLRLKTVEPISADLVRVRLQLQDTVMGQLRVLVENDRLLTPEVHRVPVARVETGRTNRRFVVLEAAGRDELVIEKLEGFEPLSRQQSQWQEVSSMFGGKITEAYEADSDVIEPQLAYTLKDRALVQTVAARIGLAQTLLVLDENGAYRAVQLYRLDNRTEQFLEIELPEGARLWTASVAGEPIKPTGGSLTSTGTGQSSSRRRLRIPLVKTSAGDLDYEVVLKYGGTLPALGRSSSVTVPLIRALNINAELSQVRLWLPDTYAWFDFDGTMRVVKDEGELAAGYVAYSTEQAVRMAETLRAADSFAQVRAAANLKRLRLQFDRAQNTTTQFQGNKDLQQVWIRNASILEEAEKQALVLDQTLELQAALDNRGNLNSYYDAQIGSRANNVVQESGMNFDVDATGSAGDEDDARIAGLDKKEKLPSRGRKGRTQPRAPEVAQGEQKRVLKDKKSKKRRGRRGRRADGLDRVGRYQQYLEMEDGLDEFPTGIPSSVAGGIFDIAQGGAAGGAVHFGSAGAAGPPTLPSGLTSLDVHIPMRGILYQFTTPRGDVTITARAVSRPFLANLARLAIVFAVIAVLWRGYKFVLQERFADKYGRTISIALIVAGMVSVLTGVLPLAGVLAIIVGLVPRFGMWKNRQPQ